jgi:gamma-glutamyltranspeptidase/glutathione hydrolase
MERAGFDGMAHNSADYLHLLTECVKAAMADREYHFGDPLFTQVPMDGLLSPDHLDARLRQIDPARAHPTMYEPLLGQGTPADGPQRTDLPKVEADTSYVAVVDRWGNAFSATPSDGSWNSPVVPGLGLIPSSFAPFDYFPARIAVESRVPQAVRDDLAARGHEVKEWPAIT